MVLVVVLMVVAGIVLGARAAVQAFAGEEASPTPPPTSETLPDDAVSTGPSDDELANPVECTPEAVALSLPAMTTVKKGAKTALPVTITNTGQVPCLLDVGHAELVVTVHSGDDLVWSSQHCGATEPRRILLDIGAEDTTSVTWPGTRSTPKCPDEPPVAKPGTYRAVATLWTAVEDGAEPTEIATAEVTFTVK